MIIEELLTGKRKLERMDPVIYEKVRKKWDALAKPLDSMGKFEEITARIAAAQRREDPDISKKCLVVMCADNGVVTEGISQSGQEVTLAVAKAMGEGKSNVCKMAVQNKIEVLPVDIGINCIDTPKGLLPRKIARGTKNFARERAMSEKETLQALESGILIAMEKKKEGCSLFCSGEMGIGNTSSSTALAAALLGKNAAELTGAGAGLDQAGLERKRKIIQGAIDRYGLYQAKPLEVLGAVGGFDLAGLCGLVIGGALAHVPVILDGSIALSAAYAAVKIFPETADYVLASHISREPIAEALIKEMNLLPVIDANMALGEGTGAVMFCGLLDTAMSIYSDRLSFSDIKIEAYKRFDGEEK